MTSEVVTSHSHNVTLMVVLGILAALAILGIVADAVFMSWYPEFTEEYAEKKRQEAEASQTSLSQPAAADGLATAEILSFPLQDKEAA